MDENQSNVIKTMIVICVFYAVAWLPMHVYYLLANLSSDLTFLETGYYAVMFIAFLYICTNPLIYAAKFEPVRRTLLALIPCRKGEQQPQFEFNTRAATSTHNVQEHSV